MAPYAFGGRERHRLTPGRNRPRTRDARTFDKGGTQYDRLRLLMGDSVVTCLHADHRGQRRLLQRAFRPSRVTGHTELMGTHWARA